MRLRLRWIFLAALGLFVVAAPFASAQGDAAPEPDAKTLRFVQRAIAWYPDSTFRLVENTRYRTASGSYRVVVVERKCASQLLSGQPRVVVDEITNSAWLGSVGELPFQGAGAGPDALRTFLEGFLPEALKGALNRKVRVEWDVGPRKPGVVIPLTLMIDTGYGEYRRPAGVTSDGKFLIMGSEMSLNDDPVAVRRRILADSESVIWDSSAGESPPLEIVEFSDLECPACKGKWPIIQMVLGRFAGSIRHGMVSFPLTAIHPWAFRAASASWCVALQNAEALIPFKETFYSLQREMEVSLVTPTSVDFIAGHGLDEAAFRECYLRPPSIVAVHKQIDLGQAMGIHSTPTYFVNGWMIQVPDGSWFPAMLERLKNGEEPQ
jgi:protein-disulfide isomerase